MPLGLIFTVDGEGRVYSCEGAGGYEDDRLSRPELDPEEPLRAYCRWWNGTGVEWFLPSHPPGPKQAKAARLYAQRVVGSEARLRGWLARNPGQWVNVLLHRPELASVMPGGDEALEALALVRRALGPADPETPRAETEIEGTIRAMGYAPHSVAPDYSMAFYMSRALGRKRLEWYIPYDDAKDPEGLTCHALFLAAGHLGELHDFAQALEMASDAAGYLYVRMVCCTGTAGLDESHHRKITEGLMKLWSVGVWPIAPNGRHLCYYPLRAKALKEIRSEE